MTYDQVLSELFSLQRQQHMRPDLGPMRAAARAFGDPHRDLEFIHITGTNGKGSTAAFLTSIFRAAGYRVATYTSPFLVEYRERITLDGAPIPEEEVVRLYHLVQEKTPGLSFFEITTLIALLYFAQQRPDVVVWEVGLGGSFDATKVVEARTAVITNVELDHTEVLGKDKESIARDKCGIISRGASVFSAEADPVIREVIRTEAARRAASVVFVEPLPAVRKLGLLGAHQRYNAAIAVAVAGAYGLSRKVVDEGLASASWPGRLQFLEKNVLLDCAHNPAGMASLAAFLKTLSYERLFVVIGVSREKDLEAMLAQLPAYEEIVFTQARVFRALPVGEVSFYCTRIADPHEALAYARVRARGNDLVVVCGSIFLIGDVLRCGPSGE